MKITLRYDAPTPADTIDIGAIYMSKKMEEPHLVVILLLKTEPGIFSQVFQEKLLEHELSSVPDSTPIDYYLLAPEVGFNPVPFSISITSISHIKSQLGELLFENPLILEEHEKIDRLSLESGTMSPQPVKDMSIKPYSTQNCSFFYKALIVATVVTATAVYNTMA